jgi:hypothetical protein
LKECPEKDPMEKNVSRKLKLDKLHDVLGEELYQAIWFNLKKNAQNFSFPVYCWFDVIPCNQSNIMINLRNTVSPKNSNVTLTIFTAG